MQEQFFRPVRARLLRHPCRKPRCKRLPSSALSEAAGNHRGTFKYFVSSLTARHTCRAGCLSFFLLAFWRSVALVSTTNRNASSPAWARLDAWLPLPCDANGLRRDGVSPVSGCALATLALLSLWSLGALMPRICFRTAKTCGRWRQGVGCTRGHSAHRDGGVAVPAYILIDCWKTGFYALAGE